MFWFLTKRPTKHPTEQKASGRTSFPVSSKAQGQTPQIRETLMFRDVEVDVLRRAYKRSIGVTLQVNGRIRVSAPKLVSRTQIEAFLAAHEVWIEANLERYRHVREAHPKKQFHEGEVLPLLGRDLKISFRCGTRAKPHLSVHDDKLVIEIPAERWTAFDPATAHPELRSMFVEFYTRVGKKILSDRVAHFSERMGLRPASLTFRSQKTRWGSCSAKGSISLNWRLAVAPPEVIDYVVVHELAHLRHYNHSRAFWGLVATEIPRYRELRQWLREHQYQSDFLAKRSELHA
jgi:predicted metal-dependent hydrolase